MYYWIFIKETTKNYIVISEDDIGEDETFIWDKFIDDGYELFNTNMKSQKQAHAFMKEFYREYSKLKTVPVTLKKACNFVNQFHRHHVAPQGHKFSVAMTDGDKIIGVVIAGRPVSRFRDNGKTLEITRCCVKEIYKNACSQLYSKVYRIAKELGYENLITYTLEEEIGVSLRAVGFEEIAISLGGKWNCKSRKRNDNHPLGSKKVWQKKIVI
ncbi:XF1762 family protein [Wukongibacter sp. M2B1]|uniref:XF1762 family protein n=1 Tax=Wukongibacter sp. M2B1 TaxID=3088895 RepID=UPI003D7B401E